MGDDVRLVQEVRLSGERPCAKDASSDPTNAAGVPRACGREPWLSADVLAGMLAGAPGLRILLVGEREGILAARLSAESGSDVTWLDPFAGHAQMVAASGPGIRPGVTRVDGGLLNTPFADAEFDAVASQFAIEFAPDPSEAIGEWARVLRPGGILALVTMNALFKGSELRPRARPLHEFAPADLEALATGAGLGVRGIRTLIPNLRLPRFYRGDMSYSFRFEGLPYFGNRGMLLFLQAVK